ncbi:hypothetical protein AWR27_03435 [Spirosoma montaniterrae]|uniref:Uncharacterized protein n=1 Tax=Spirosoma montaniterrae TaxID=1178516 RepID=A0A1P9WT17_9BACT|nr:hypothetical protein AWR27_03435 [Spirosoma montaniterrae]
MSSLPFPGAYYGHLTVSRTTAGVTSQQHYAGASVLITTRPGTDSLTVRLWQQQTILPGPLLGYRVSGKLTLTLPEKASPSVALSGEATRTADSLFVSVSRHTPTELVYYRIRAIPAQP